MAHPLTQKSGYESNHVQTIQGFVAEKGDFKGEKPETEESKKKALTGADIVIIPAGVPRMFPLEPRRTCIDIFIQASLA